jgi:hypothetical protein
MMSYNVVMGNTTYQVIVKRGTVSYGKFFKALSDAKSYFYDEYAGGTCTIYRIQNNKSQVVAGFSH